MKGGVLSKLSSINLPLVIFRNLLPRCGCLGMAAAGDAVTWLGVLGKRRLKATSKASSFGCYFP
jgi:hypothetical protein